MGSVTEDYQCESMQWALYFRLVGRNQHHVSDRATRITPVDYPKTGNSPCLSDISTLITSGTARIVHPPSRENRARLPTPVSVDLLVELRNTRSGTLGIYDKAQGLRHMPSLSPWDPTRNQFGDIAQDQLSIPD
ncbi:hypothetical protein RSOLAG1IB_09533 [Rhizoctonia solani AG-1 IB]|uniref:Uncharacterized protein n=1 Tax=Thanatephorus cucumeris (strain AG1-IB / isolate 7/3/14) TaxID=1108050 RepID=A0A0B7FTV0_THACB|nr:hypothetical protein RSOLAG1IB_09533 [Rhizoctonia solani AG-1 IB]